MMKAGKDKVVSLHYTLTVAGDKVESSHDRDEPLWVLLGHGQLIPGLEAALEGHEAGENLAVDVAAVDRSEEHTSELQSRRDLVCRLLLEKKKKDQVGASKDATVEGFGEQPEGWEGVAVW